MSKHDPEIAHTSRRDFTKAIVTAAVAVPVVASLTGCQKQTTTREALATPTPASGATRQECFPSGGGTEEHIPPIGLDGGGGSMIVDTRNRMVTSDPRAPFHYVEHPDITREHDMLGDLRKVRVITELADDPFITDTQYTLFESDCYLLLWYQTIAGAAAPSPKPSPGPVDCIYGSNDFNRDPDVSIRGGRKAAGRRFSITTNERVFEDMSYKCGNSYRYRHPDPGGPRTHFRVGQWRIVRSDGVTPVTDILGNPLEDNTSPQKDPLRDHFRLYLTFRDFV
jgi:hypothetical protein